MAHEGSLCKILLYINKKKVKQLKQIQNQPSCMPDFQKFIRENMDTNVKLISIGWEELQEWTVGNTVNKLSSTKEKKTRELFTDDEHSLLILLLHSCGWKWKKIGNLIKNRSDSQCKSHGQKYMQMLEELKK